MQFLPSLRPPGPRHHLCQVERVADGTRPHDLPGDLFGLPLFAVAGEHLGEFVLAGAIHPVGRGHRALRVHPHVERAGRLKRKTSLRSA